MLEDARRGGEGFKKSLELDDEHGLVFGQRNEIELGFENDAERAFGADHELREIDWP